MLETVIKAMKESRKLSFSYQKYGKQQPDADREVSPYCVKLFRQRWYVLGPIANGEMRLFSLDRMGDVYTLDSAQPTENGIGSSHRKLIITQVTENGHG